MKRPVVLLLSGAAAGALFGWVTQIPLLFLVPLLLPLPLLPAGARRAAIVAVCVFLLVFAQARTQKPSPLADRIDEPFAARVLITGVGKKTEYLQNYDAQLLRESRRYRVRFQTPAEAKALFAGEVVSARAELRRPDRTQNDLLFSYSDYLRRNGIDGLLRAVGPVTAEGRAKDPLLGLRHRFAEALMTGTEALFSDSTALLFRSVLSGRTALSPEEETQYRDLGISHLFAVSGLHIGLLFGAVRVLTGRWLGRPGARLAGLFAVAVYTWLIGFPVSAMRALIMAAVLVLARTFRAPHDPLTALFFAMTLLLALFPGSIVDAGFHLSAAGVWSVIWVRPVLLARAGREGSLLLSAFAVQLGILPAMLLHFQRAPLAGVLANLLLIPLFSVMIAAGTLALVLYAVAPAAAALPAAAAQLLSDVFFVLADALSALALPVLAPVWIGAAAVLWLYLLLYLWLRRGVWFAMPVRFRSGLLRAAAASFAVSVLLSAQPAPYVLFLDVGQGDATLIRDGGRSVLIDTGGEMQEGLPDSLTAVVLPSLAREGVYRLDAVLVSHLDADHMENLTGLAARVPVTAVYLPSGLSGTQEAADLIAELAAFDVPVFPLGRGDRLRLSGTGELEVLHDARFGDGNDSLVVRYNTDSGSVLFPGDLEAGGERRLEGDLQADVLKAGHHGSATSSSEALLERVQPQAAVITAGYRNPFGHPHPDVLSRMQDRSISLYRTDRSGNQRLQFTPGGIRMTPYPSLAPTAAQWLSFFGMVPIAAYTIEISRRHYATRGFSTIIA